MRVEQAKKLGFKLFDDGFWRKPKGKTWQKYLTSKCKKCSKEFIHAHKKGDIFCSMSCASKGHQRTLGMKFKRKNQPQYRITRAGYSEVYEPKHPLASSKGRVLEHRFIMCEKLNKILKSNENVHHINGDTLDNRVENLVVVSRSEHMSIHNRQRVMKTCSKTGRFIKLINSKHD